MKNNFPIVDSDHRSLESLAKRARLQPEKVLMLAVLKAAIDCYRESMMKGSRKTAADERWFLERNEVWPFSFENICFNLELDAGCIRQTVLGWKMYDSKSMRQLKAS